MVQGVFFLLHFNSCTWLAFTLYVVSYILEHIILQNGRKDLHKYEGCFHVKKKNLLKYFNVFKVIVLLKILSFYTVGNNLCLNG